MNNTTTYLNTPATGILPAEFTEAANKLYSSFAENASSHAEQWRDQYQPQIKNRVASFLNAPAGSIAFLPNFSWGINGIVQSLKGTEKVLLYKNDYPSLTEPFKINAFDIGWIESSDGFTIDIEEIKKKIVEEKVDVVAISHVQWLSGFKIDLKELSDFCKQHGVILIVDATQSVGAISVDLSVAHVDVFIASTYKWMNAGFGTGVMYVSESFLNNHTPAVGGNNSYADIDGEWKYVPSIRSYEPGHANMYGFTVLDAAIQDKMKRGVDTIEKYNRQLAQQLINEVKDSGFLLGPDGLNNRCSIVFLKDEKGLWAKMQEQKIVASQRGGNIRIGFHYYNTEADVQKLVACIRSL